MPAETPQSYARKVCGYISNDNDVVKHVKRMWGIEFAPQDIARIRRDMPGQFVTRAGVKEPLPLTAPLTTTNDNGFDPLAKALFAYHAKRSTGKTKAYWERLAA